MKSNSKLEQFISKSPWSKQANYSAHLPVDDLLRSIGNYTRKECGGVPNTWQEYFKLAVPAFQRSNDKWNLQMKIKFVENVLCGHRSTISLFTIDNSRDPSLRDSKNLDGLQRLTALSDFLQDKFAVFGDYKFSDLEGDRVFKGMGVNIEMQIFNFSNEAEAVQFYIDMNENITHSNDDIEKAKCYLEGLSDV